MQDDELKLQDMFKALWMARSSLVIAMLLTSALVVAVMLLIAAKSSVPMVNHFNLTGIYDDRGLKYPNGTTFHVKDITSRRVLDAAAQEMGIDEVPDDAVNITLYNPIRAGAFKQYENRLAEKDLTGAEITELDRLFLDELSYNVNRTVRLSVDGESLGLNRSQTEELLFTIPRMWEQEFAEHYRVLDHTQLHSFGIANSANLLSSVEILVVDKTMAEVEAGLALINSDSRLSMLTTEHGFTASDILKIVTTFKNVYLNPIISQNLSRAEPFTEFYILNLKLDIKRVQDEMTGINSTIDDLRSIIGQEEQSVRPDNSSSTLDVGGGALGSIIDLANQASLSNYMTEILTRRQSLTIEKAALQVKLDRIAGEYELSENIIDVAQDKFNEITFMYNDLLSKAREFNRQSRSRMYAALGRPTIIDNRWPPKLRLYMAFTFLLTGLAWALIVLMRWKHT